MPVRLGLPCQQANQLLTRTQIGGCVYPESLSLAEAAFGEVNEQKLLPPHFGFLAGTYGQVLDSLVKMQISALPPDVLGQNSGELPVDFIFNNFAEGATESFEQDLF